MSDHLPECHWGSPLMKAYSDIVFGTGYPCQMCRALRACEERVWRDANSVVSETYKNALQDSVRIINTYADETHNCVREYGTGACLPQHGDRCDITAALRVAAQKIKGLGG